MLDILKVHYPDSASSPMCTTPTNPMHFCWNFTPIQVYSPVLFG